MNNISLLAPSLEMWGAVFTMSCFAYLVTHRNTLGEAAGRYLTPLELNLSLLLVCSPAVGTAQDQSGTAVRGLYLSPPAGGQIHPPGHELFHRL